MKVELAKILTITLTIIGMLIAAAVWAGGRHSALKDAIIEESYNIKNEIKSDSKEKYVQRYEYSELKEKINGLKEDQKRVIDTLDKLDKKFDELYIQKRREWND